LTAILGAHRLTAKYTGENGLRRFSGAPACASTPHKESSGRFARDGSALSASSRCAARRAKPWACPWWDQALAPTRGSSKYTPSSGAQDGVNLGTVVPETRKASRWGDGVEPGHTPRPRVRSRCAHAVEFSKTVAPLRKGFPSQGHARIPLDRSGLVIIA